FIDVLRRMGAEIEIQLHERSPEPYGTIVAESSSLRATEVEPAEIPGLIDELPLLAVVAAFAEGTTRVRGAAELRVKESDRIAAVVRNGRAMGMHVEDFPDGFEVKGPTPLRGASIDAMNDHRIAMAFAIAALGAPGATAIAGGECATVSYPSFFATLDGLRDG
ncbi:MAG: 3-phosphoshikimate 1-carboxyvinyltransferase, partial [Candidatus Eremiobacteraeota bacterium]|nr:3-phosphoshikimate 1-carboxyvinyltransferase [Candidatus Eremiobacteraeota bacterium]